MICGEWPSHDFEGDPARCWDCGAPNPDHDPTPHGAELVTDPHNSPSYPWTTKQEATR